MEQKGGGNVKCTIEIDDIEPQRHSWIDAKKLISGIFALFVIGATCLTLSRHLVGSSIYDSVQMLSSSIDGPQEATCSCTLPNDGFVCTDGYIGYCGTNELCIANEFPRGLGYDPSGCVPSCSCDNKDHLSPDNGFTCSDGYKDTCAVDEICVQQQFPKGWKTFACKVPMCTCDHQYKGAPLNTFSCQGGFQGSCEAGGVCVSDQFPESINARLGCRSNCLPQGDTCTIGNAASCCSGFCNCKSILGFDVCNCDVPK